MTRQRLALLLLVLGVALFPACRRTGERADLTLAGSTSIQPFADKWAATLDLSTSRAKSTERITEMEAGQYDTANGRPLPETVTLANYNQITGLQYDRNNLSTMRLTDPESWGQNGYDKTITTDDRINAIRLGLQRDMDGLFSRIDGGVNFSDREKTKGATESKLLLANRAAGTNPGGALPAGTAPFALPGTGLTTIAFNPADALASYRFEPNVNGDILRKGWTVQEKVTTAYVKGDLDTTVAGLGLRGNVGLQVIQTDQSSTAAVVDNTSQSSYTLRTAGKTYTDLLPSANFVLDVARDQFVKFGIGKQMARPRMDQLSAFSRSEVNESRKWTGSGGNPTLDPFRATAVDLSYERYFAGNKGYVSAAAFYKKLDSYIFDFKNTGYDFTGFPNLSNRVPASNIGEFTQPVNGKGGTVSGIELAASVPLNLLTPMLDGFGLQASVSSTDSAIKPFGDADTRPLPGLSRNVTQLVAYYEKSGFSARVATRMRSKFIAEIEGFGADREYKYAASERITDMQLGYEFQTGALKGLNLLLQVNNLNNEPYRELDNDGNQSKLDQYGRTILFGVTYKF